LPCRALAEAVGSRARIVHVSSTVAMLAVKIAGRLVCDVVLTRGGLRGLMAGLLVSNRPPTGRRRPSEWLAMYGLPLLLLANAESEPTRLSIPWRRRQMAFSHSRESVKEAA